MYGLPSDFDAQVFVGRQLEAVTHAVNAIILAFGERLTVSVSGSLPYRAPGNPDPAVDRPPVAQTTLVGLVGRLVTSFTLMSPRELVLEFEDDGSLTLLDDSDTYESYLINIDDREIVV
jgi:hypothetical protein